MWKPQKKKKHRRDLPRLFLMRGTKRKTRACSRDFALRLCRRAQKYARPQWRSRSGILPLQPVRIVRSQSISSDFRDQDQTLFSRRGSRYKDYVSSTSFLSLDTVRKYEPPNEFAVFIFSSLQIKIPRGLYRVCGFDSFGLNNFKLLYQKKEIRRTKSRSLSRATSADKHVHIDCSNYVRMRERNNSIRI